MMKGQSAFEMFITVATLMAFSVPIILLATSTSHLKLEDVSLVHGRSLVQQVADGMNEVYLQGDGAERTLLLDLPSNTQNITITESTVTLYLSTNEGTYSITHPIFANTTYYSSSSTGLMTMVLRMGNGKVKVR